MAASDHAIICDRAYMPTKRYLLELTAQEATLAHNKLLSQQIEALMETLCKLSQQLQVVSPSHSLIMQIGGCHIYGGAHEPGQCIAQEDSSRGYKLHGSSKLPQIPRLQPRRIIGIQPREKFHTGLKLEESSREPIQQGAWKSTSPKFQPRDRSL